MLIHSNKVISLLFNNYLLKTLDFRPLLFIGQSGVGKFHYIQAFIKSSNCPKYFPFFELDKSYLGECSCELCSKISSNNSFDLLILTGDEGIQDFKLKVNEFINHNPLELSHRYLVIRNIHKYSKDILNTFLKILEEPYPTLRIFATSINIENLSPAIISRFHVFKFNSLSSNDLSQIVLNNKKLNSLSSVLPKLRFYSVNQLICYRKYSFEEYYDLLFNKSTDIITLQDNFDKFIKLVKSDGSFQYEEVLKYFLEYYIEMINKFCNNRITQKSVNLFNSYFRVILSSYRGSIFKYIDSPINYFFINVDNQFYSIISSIHMLKIITGV